MDTKDAERTANIVDPDQTASFGSDLGPQCLLMSVCPKT